MIKFWNKTEIPREGSFVGEEEYVTDIIRAITINIENSYKREIENIRLKNIMKQKIEKNKSYPSSNKKHRKGMVLDRIFETQINKGGVNLTSQYAFDFFEDFSGIMTGMSYNDEGDISFDIEAKYDLYDGFLEKCIYEAITNWSFSYNYAQTGWSEEIDIGGLING